VVYAISFLCRGRFCFLLSVGLRLLRWAYCYGHYIYNGIFCSVGFLLVPWAFSFTHRGVFFFSAVGFSFILRAFKLFGAFFSSVGTLLCLRR
jgi:hypothetical protein